jgi:RNA polymerase sigma-70 factor (ECF subfamily)
VKDEAILVVQAQRGSEEAFTALVEAYQTHIYNLCYRMLGEAESAEDASQETFLRAFQHLQRYDHGRPFATWLLSIAAHYCIDRLRRRRLSFMSWTRRRWRNHGLPDADTQSQTELVRREQRSRCRLHAGTQPSIVRHFCVTTRFRDRNRRCLHRL